MSTIADVYSALQHNGGPMTLSDLMSAVEEATGRRPDRKQVCHAASQLTREGAAVRVRHAVYRAARQAAAPMYVPADPMTHAVSISRCRPPREAPCNISHGELLDLLFGEGFEPTPDQVPLVRELTHAVDAINASHTMQ